MTCGRCGISLPRIRGSRSRRSRSTPEPGLGRRVSRSDPPRGLHVRQTGLLSEVVTAYGGWGDRQILIGGSASMIQATKEALVSRGADASRIQHDPL